MFSLTRRGAGVRNPLRVVLLLAALAAPPACGGSSDGPTGPGRTAVASVVVTPASVPLEVGATATLTATTFDADGRVLPGRAVSWASSAPEVARVGDDGVVTAVAVGTAAITATSEGKEGRGGVTVSVPWSLAPPAQTIAVGDGAQLSATRGDTALADVAWSSSDASVATVSATGYVTAVSVGSATITGTLPRDRTTRTVAVTVVEQPVYSVTVEPATANVPAGTSFQFAAVLRDHLGNVLSGREVSWTTSSSDYVTVSSTGLVTVRVSHPGTSVGVNATSEGKVGSATVVLSAPADDAAASVTITPDPAAVDVGGSVVLFSKVMNAAGVLLEERSVSWTTLDPAVVYLQDHPQYAVVGGRSPGTARLVATVEGRADTAQVVVTFGTIVRVVLQGTGSLAAYGTGCDPYASDGVVYAYAYNRYDVLATGRPVQWSFPPGTGSVTQTYSGHLPANAIQVTATRAGTAYVSATVDGATGTLPIGVYDCGTLTIAPSSTSLPVGGQARLTSTFRTSSGSVITNPSTYWSSSDPAIATVDGTGLVTGVSPGVATITNGYLSLRASATVTVVAP